MHVLPILVTEAVVYRWRAPIHSTDVDFQVCLTCVEYRCFYLLVFNAESRYSDVLRFHEVTSYSWGSEKVPIH